MPQMLRDFLHRTFPREERVIWRMPFFLVLGVVASMIGIYWFYLGPIIGALQPHAYAPTESDHRVRVEIGGTLFAIPAHYTRTAGSRRDAVLPFAELHILLPDFEPYSKSKAETFLRTDAQSPLIVITLRASDQPLPAYRIFDALYAPYIEGNSAAQIDGLQGYRFRTDSPYFGKEIFRSISEQNPTAPLFICAQDALAGCEGRFFLGRTAQVSYRFMRHYLPHWQHIHTHITTMIRDFRAATRTPTQH